LRRIAVEIFWNLGKMLKLMGSFNTLVKVRLSLFNLEKKAILFYPWALTDYCDIIRKTKAGDAACEQCDKQAFLQTMKTNTPYTYICHAGLREIVFPIVTYDKEHMGYLMLGQVRTEKDMDSHFFRGLCKKIGFSKVEKLKSAYDKLPSLNAEQCEACINILQALTTHMLFDHYFHYQNESLPVRASNYISKNIDKKLSLKKITENLKMGKTTLCKSVKENFNKTVNELIRSLRIEKAKHLLQTTDLPVSIIAEQVGIIDYNYFTKVFSKETGTTPSQFRKLRKS
jgi:AraC-like DNA-binding protein